MAGLDARCGGLLQAAKAKPGRFVLTTARCEIPAEFRRDHEGRIVGLWFATPARRDISLELALATIARFDGSVSYAVLRDGKRIAGREADEPLAVGSAFKLAVLAALLERVEAGQARWGDTIALSAGDISLPTGRLREIPPGAPLTLHTLATMMIAESDNTAADALIRFLGRARLESLAGISPFLTTREFFLLKADDGLYRRYAEADRAGQRLILDGLAARKLPRAEEMLRPRQPHAEWRMSTAGLCAWMGRVAQLPLMRINPGPVGRSGWRDVAFKGGSETGVLNLTTQASGADGRKVCVSVTWNAGRGLDEARLAALYASLFLALRKTP